jgi:hypothetical protein
MAKRTGHFSFMDILPPEQEEPLVGSDYFRAEITDRIINFACG